MAEALLLGALVGTAFNELYQVLKHTVAKTVWCRKYCKDLVQDLDTHEPIFRHICLHMPSPVLHEWEQRLLDFKDKLEQGRSLVEACSQLSVWHPFQRYRNSRAILKLRQDILLHLRDLAALNTLQLQQIIASLQDVVKQQDELREAILESVMQPNCSGIHEAQTSTKRLDELQLDQFLVGMHNPIQKVKSLLLSGEEKMVMIVGGMGGIGKTTLALSICKDPEVREFFNDRIHFFTVSQSPDMKELLSTIWEQVVEEPLPFFQNEEDACRQLKGKLLNLPSVPRLLVLDDVWSKVNLESLLFEVKCCRTLITTRQAPTLETQHSQTYTLELLSEENAERLFSYCAFRHDSIPECAEKTIVKEVISECKRLPLALKVIGVSLSNIPMAAWHNARDKLRIAKPLGDSHKGLLQRLRTSVDALDPILQECFLDLGAYPEDSHCSANTLLDIWVHVRGMEWVDAVLALAELGSRCLLDISIDKDSGYLWDLTINKDIVIDERAAVRYALECGNASGLVFSQHDVLRDLALYLCGGNQPPSKCSRLLMPQKGMNIPKDWQSEAPLEAQLVSISITGAIMEQDMMAFPSTEALLLYFDNGNLLDKPLLYFEPEPYSYPLPSFVESMCKLKVMRISCPLLRDLPESFGNLSNLAALYLFSSWLPKLPTTFGLLVGLKRLDLSGCHELQDLPENFGELRSLEDLVLWQCYGLERLPENFGLLGNLKRLILEGCLKLRELPENFGELRCLEYLSLEWCRELRGLPGSFGQLHCLGVLSLRGCIDISQLPESFGQLRKLRRLRMDGVHMNSLPASVSVGLVGLESVECSEHLVPIWKAFRGDIAPHPHILPRSSYSMRVETWYQVHASEGFMSSYCTYL